MGALFSYIRKKCKWKAFFLWDFVEDYVKNRFIFGFAALLILLLLGF